MWYRLTNPDKSTLSVGKHLITKDSRLSVAYYSVDHGYSPAKWDLHISNVRLSDAANYQCHVITKTNPKSSRSNVKLIVEGKKEKKLCTCSYNVYMKGEEKQIDISSMYSKDNHGRVKF